jgi:hypothetical protein
MWTQIINAQNSLDGTKACQTITTVPGTWPVEQQGFQNQNDNSCLPKPLSNIAALGSYDTYK